jgi:hypothetical protein
MVADSQTAKCEVCNVHSALYNERKLFAEHVRHRLIRLQRLAVGCKSLVGKYFYLSAIRYFTGKPNLLMVKSFFNLKLHFDKEGMISTG